VVETETVADVDLNAAVGSPRTWARREVAEVAKCVVVDGPAAMSQWASSEEAVWHAYLC
jgi:hypothetical protein